MSKLDFSASSALYEEARRLIPGGVTSSVRAGALPHPLYFDRGEGAYLYDVDGNRYLDFVQAYGPSILGHAPQMLQRAISDQAARGLTFGAQHRAELRVAELICAAVPGAEQVALSTTGSEAVAVALRAARSYTGRAKIMKFEGHYHGWLDGVFASTGFDPARSGTADHPTVVPATTGISPGALADVVIAPWNDAVAVEQLFAEHRDEIAALILEPLNVNGGVIFPAPGFLARLREITRAHGTVLVFDEVITGFRLALGGAQEHYGIRADLAVFAKAMAGGLPISAIAGSRDVLSVISTGKMLHNGTFNGSALATAAAIATLKYLTDGASVIYPRLRWLGDRLAHGLAGASPSLTVRSEGPIAMTSFGEPACVRSVRDRRASDGPRLSTFLEALLHRGVHARPVWYISTVHTETDIDTAISAVRDVLTEPALALG